MTIHVNKQYSEVQHDQAVMNADEDSFVCPKDSTLLGLVWAKVDDNDLLYVSSAWP